MAEASAAARAPAASHGRRSYLVDRGFQLKYALLLAGAGVLLALVFGFWLYQAHVQAIQLVPLDAELRALVDRSDRELLVAFAGIAALMGLALAFVGVVITHRVAGPVFVMGHYMTVLSQGRYPRMRTLRRSDELRRFFLVFLQAVDAMKEREAAHAAVLEDAVERMRAAAPRAPELLPAAEALAAAARVRRQALQLDDPEPTPIYVDPSGREPAP
ncbi:MAG TPA: hypothetical protein VLS93_16415 [Anaeromyxobacteraceae bacterium]|nr:hypothetical protein [Anaeromyxobacteraceae bacterium]